MQCSWKLNARRWLQKSLKALASWTMAHRATVASPKAGFSLQTSPRPPQGRQHCAAGCVDEGLDRTAWCPWSPLQACNLAVLAMHISLPRCLASLSNGYDNVSTCAHCEVLTSQGMHSALQPAFAYTEFSSDHILIKFWGFHSDAALASTRRLDHI